ncbi:DUF1878 domain-containing protein [Gracilibacillus sp. HCP3S3_G5_1]
MNTEERLDFLEFRQQLLFDNTSFDRMLFEYQITRNQLRSILDLFDEYRNAVDDNEEVHHGSYEQRVYDIVPQHDGNYHFAEEIALTLHENDRYTEVFEALYGDMPKFQAYLNN